MRNKIEHRAYFELKKNTPYLTHLSELWSVYCKYFGQKWSRDNGIALYISFTCSRATNSSPPGQNDRHFADDIFICIFMNGKFCILLKISLKFVPKGPIDNNPALV